MTTTVFTVNESQWNDSEMAGRAVRMIFGPDGLGLNWTGLGRAETWRPSTDMLFFFATYGTSMISASLGMAKALKVGPCRVLGDRGLLRGFLSQRFLLLFFACFFTLVGKAIFLVLVFI